MYRLFEPDGLLARIIGRLSFLIILNVLWLICSLPVITAGAATTALCFVAEKWLLEGDEGNAIRMFFTAFGQNFRRATGVWLILLALGAICALDFWAALQLRGSVWLIPALLTLVLLALELTGIFPLLARYENTLRSQLRNALAFSVINLPRVLLIWMIWGAAAGAMLIPALAQYFSAAWLLLGVSGLTCVTIRLLRPGFQKLEEHQNGRNEDE